MAGLASYGAGTDNACVIAIPVSEVVVNKYVPLGTEVKLGVVATLIFWLAGGQLGFAVVGVRV